MKPTRAQEGAGDDPPASRSLQDKRKEARDQLTLVLSFFSRVDAKASALLAIDTGMLAILTSNAPPRTTMSVLSYILAGMTTAMLAGSLWFLYRVAFPSLDGGYQSLIYFREIAERQKLPSSMRSSHRKKAAATGTCLTRYGGIPAFLPRNSTR